MSYPSLTVLMTVYNGERYLRQALGSVLRQTYPNFEFLIINDGSTDSSLQIIRSFQDKRILVHNNTHNLGQTKSLNVGLLLARGSYVARIDADDVAFPRWLETQMSFAVQHPQYVVVSTQAIVIDEANKIRRMLRSLTEFTDIVMKSYTDSPVNHGGSVLNKDVILKNGGYDENYKIIADYALWGKLLRSNHKITSTKDILMAIRIHRSSMSLAGKGKTVILETSDVMRRNIKHFSDFNVNDRDLELLYNLIYNGGSLSEPDFLRAVKMLKVIYKETKQFAGVKERTIVHWLKRQCFSVFLKRIHAFLIEKKFDLARKTARMGIEEFGLLSIFAGLYVVSLFGGLFIQRIPVLYDDFHAIRTVFRLGRSTVGS